MPFINIIIIWAIFYNYWNIKLSHSLWMAMQLISIHILIKFWHVIKLGILNIWIYVIYNEGKSTWSNFNYLHDDIWTKEKMTCDTSNKFSWKLKFSWNFDLNHSLWLFNLYIFILWHVAQSKVAVWHIDWILKKKLFT